MGAVAHGIIHVVTLSYLNMRVATRKQLNIHISFYHFVYIGGIFMATRMLKSRPTTYLESIGEHITILAIIYGVCLMVLKIIEAFTGYNGCESLDEVVNSAESQGRLLLNREEIIQAYENDTGLMEGQYDLKEDKSKSHLFISILLKLQGVMIFPMIQMIKNDFFTCDVSVLYGIGLNDQEVPNWAFKSMLFGALASCFLFIVAKPRRHFIFSCLHLIPALILFLIPYTNCDVNGWNITRALIMKIYFIHSGVIYSTSDIMILNHTHPMLSEMALAIGYVIEMIMIGIAQSVFFIANNVDSADAISGTISVFSNFTNIFIILLVVNVILAVIVRLKIKLIEATSYIEMRNNVMGIYFDSEGNSRQTVILPRGTFGNN